VCSGKTTVASQLKQITKAEILPDYMAVLSRSELTRIARMSYDRRFVYFLLKDTSCRCASERPLGPLWILDRTQITLLAFNYAILKMGVPINLKITRAAIERYLTLPDLVYLLEATPVTRITRMTARQQPHIFPFTCADFNENITSFHSQLAALRGFTKIDTDRLNAAEVSGAILDDAMNAGRQHVDEQETKNFLLDIFA
jgi:hypothetical protein